MNRGTRNATFGTAVALSAVLAACTTPGASTGQQAGGLRDQIVGTWALTSQYVTQDGKRVERFGPNPKGISIYEREGRFVSILMRPDLPKFTSNNAMTGTADENRAVVQGSTAFYGTWTVDPSDGMLKNHIDGATFPNWDGQDQKRTVAISGDEMRICVPGQIGGISCAVWKRVR